MFKETKLWLGLQIMDLEFIICKISFKYSTIITKHLLKVLLINFMIVETQENRLDNSTQNSMDMLNGLLRAPFWGKTSFTLKSLFSPSILI